MSSNIQKASLYAQAKALDLGRRGVCDLWHGADVAYPFGFYLADRAAKGRPEATAVALDLPCKVGEVAHEEVGHLILGHPQTHFHRNLGLDQQP